MAQLQTHPINGIVNYDKTTHVLSWTVTLNEGVDLWHFAGSAQGVKADKLPASTEIDGEMTYAKGAMENMAGKPVHFTFSDTHQNFTATFNHDTADLTAGTVYGLAGKSGTGTGTWSRK